MLCRALQSLYFHFILGGLSPGEYLKPGDTLSRAARCQGYKELQMCLREKFSVNNQRF